MTQPPPDPNGPEYLYPGYPSYPQHPSPGQSQGQSYGQQGYPQGPPAWRVPRPTNGLAIASMVLGIVWFWWIGSILALIFGYIARRQIRERNQGGNGMAIAGIVLGWIGVSTLVLFIGLIAIGGGSGSSSGGY